MTLAQIEQLLACYRPGARHSPCAVSEQRPRGDHDLNPDFFPPGMDMKQAAVLLPIVEWADQLSVLLTRRSDHLHDHAGQVSFPGGRVESSDDGAVDAALRESEEEIGLARNQVRVIGRLDTYLTRTGFQVSPIVGLVRSPLSLTLDNFEVAEAFEVPLSFLLDTRNRKIESRLYQGKQRYFYAYHYRGYYIWGATAGMIKNLAEILGGGDAA